MPAVTLEALMRNVDPFVAFLIVIAIGILAGILFDRYGGPSWHVQQFAGRRGIVTTALVGIAGSFIGFNLALLGGMVGFNGIAAFIGAAAGAGLALFFWRTIR
jgi:hypothetical protein